MSRLSCLSVLSLLACRTPTQGPVTTEEPAPPAEDASSRAPKQPDPLPALQGPVDMLPAETLLAFQAKSGRRVFEVLQRDALKDAFPQIYDDLSQEIIREIGADLVDLQGWVSIGADPEGPAGFALLDIEDEAFCFWVTASDSARMREFVMDAVARAGGRLQPTSLGGSEILRTGDEASFVFRDRYAFFVFVDEEDGQDWAHRMATLRPDVSLRSAAGDLTGDDLVAHGNFAAIANAFAADQRDSIQRWGADDPQFAARAEAETKLWTTVAQGLSGVTLRADMTKNTIEAEANAVMGEDEFPHPLLAPGDKPHALLDAMDGDLVMYGAANLDVDAFVEAVDLVARADGSSWSEVVAEARMVGIDLDREVKPLLTGEVAGAFVLTGSPAFLRRDDVEEKFGFSVAVGVNDEEKARVLVDGVAAQIKKMGAATTRDKQGFHRLSKKGDPTVFVGVAAGQLVVTTDPKLGGRLATGHKGNLAARAKPAASFAQMTGAGPSAVFAWNVAPVLWALTSFGRFKFDRAKRAEPERTSKEIRRLEKKLEKIEAKIDKQESLKDAAELRMMMKIVDAVGMQVFTLREDGRKVTLTGTHTLGSPSWPALVGTIADTTDAMKRLPEQEKLDALNAEATAIRVDLDRLRFGP